MGEEEEWNENLQGRSRIVTYEAEEVGTLNQLIRNHNSTALVITDGWPSLGFVLYALGYNVVTFISNKGLFHVLTTLFPYLNPVDFDWEVPEKNDQPFSESYSLWFQVHTVDKAITILSLTKWSGAADYIVGSLPSRGRKDLQLGEYSYFTQVHTSHIKHGGITLGRWTILLSHAMKKAVIKLRTGTTVRRRLRHILDLTIKGICHGSKIKAGLNNKRKRNEKPCYKVDDCVKPGDIHMDVIATCVWQPYEFIKRPISEKELYLIYDLQSEVQDILVRADTNHSLNSDIVSAFPEKIGHALVEGVLGELLGQPNEDLVNKEDVVRKVENLIREEEWELNDEKAARNDNCEIQTQQWDLYLMRSLPIQLGGWIVTDNGKRFKPMICTGNTTISPKHNTLFEALREISLIRF